MSLSAFRFSCPVLICNMLLFLCYFSLGLRVPDAANDIEKSVYAKLNEQPDEQQSEEQSEEQSGEQSDGPLDESPLPFGDMRGETVANKQGQGAIRAVEVEATLGKAVDAGIAPGDKIAAPVSRKSPSQDIPGGSLDSMLNIILMTGKARESQNFFDGINGIWLLMPDSYVYDDIDRYREPKNYLNYWRICIISLSTQSTVLGLSHIDYVLENPKNGDIAVPHFDHLKRYLNLSHSYQLVKKVKATFGLNQVELNFHLIRDGGTLHLVELYRSPMVESFLWQWYYPLRKRMFDLARLDRTKFNWIPFK
eukprot:gnl/TRDRNA2_/TRDRNA2_175426_c2_seq23.p1 gnl/TRDRNA2_/TRDRNA2_175426_c2~~gnl/TRDRNA2_/TRDRNA2_175426_c2_seq23.p1  ORF type:complete len:308 (-),score=18.54 gnl/TRDRNA2_/TRDRNA2_175426_c2_seq23:319-1242(-)